MNRLASPPPPSTVSIAIWTGILSLFILAASLSIWAAPQASLSGKVMNPSGALIPSAQVTIAAQGSNLKQTALTDSEGSYTFAALAPGTYRIEARQEGFRPLTQSGVVLEPGQALELDLRIELGEQTTAVTVTESSLHIETADTTLGDKLGSPKISSVPLNGRSFTDLLALQPGVVPASSRQPNAVVMSGCTSNSPSGDLNPGNLSVSGQRETSNGFVLNGSSVQEDFNMGSGLIPNLDSIEDLRVLTTNYDAQYGNYSGGQVVVTTKSGTNALHGSGLEFLRNTTLDARNYFSSDRARYDQQSLAARSAAP